MGGIIIDMDSTLETPTRSPQNGVPFTERKECHTLVTRIPKVLLMTDYFYPGFRAGGGVRVVSNMVERLSRDVHFTVVTRDRDFLNQHPYPNININAESKVRDATVYYIKPSSLSFGFLASLINRIDHDILYLNSFFSPRIAFQILCLRRLGLIPRVSLIIAPRGELHPSALHSKAFKKSVYLKVMRWFGFLDGVRFHSSSPTETQAIYAALGHESKVVEAADLMLLDDVAGVDVPLEKEKGYLKIIYLGRILSYKNLYFALEVLSRVRSKVGFSIYGIPEDKAYLEMCLKFAKTLPHNITVVYKGEIAHANVSKAIRDHHLLFCPSLSESFGYAILEGLMNGVPVLVGDKTPWHGLAAKGIGWDIPLSDQEVFVQAIESLADVDQEEFNGYSRRAREVGIAQVNNQMALEDNLNLFRTAL